MQEYIVVKGARENNLKNITVSIPKRRLVVITGLSGSGKSTLALDTLQKECMRQHMESMGLVTDFVSRPKVESITGLSPSISVGQHLTNRNPRSTVGTATEVFTYLRLLYAKLGVRSCPQCKNSVPPEFLPTEESARALILGEDEDRPQGGGVRCSQCGFELAALTVAHFSFNLASEKSPTSKPPYSRSESVGGG